MASKRVISDQYHEMPGCGDPAATGYTIHVTARRWRWLPRPKTELAFHKYVQWPEAQRFAKEFLALGKRAKVEVHPFECDEYDLYLGAPDTPENFPERHR